MTMLLVDIVDGVAMGVLVDDEVSVRVDVLVN